MSKVASITIRLEIQADAPFIKFESVDSNEVKTKRQLQKKSMAERKKHKKVNARSNTEGDSFQPTAVDNTTESVNQASKQAQCLGNRKYTEVIVQTFSKDQTVLNKQKSFTPDNQEELSSAQAIASSSSLSPGTTGEVLNESGLR
ncbi:hypothetical protein WUBG_05732 [Wuchereria bancrofti]|uniref:Uncharacterized protein n=1 Tax=Wuchereria bancrofti TaxID=6293 RepID=J9F1N0_WUCBA|nr:hypothetical protein WUBG_05732 [Wuchereria bancrofti]